MSVKRPRIDPAISDRIDAARGRIPFEPYVNDALEQHVSDDWRPTFERLIGSVPKDDLLHFLLMEGYGFNWPDIAPAIDREHRRWQEAAEEAANDE